MLNCFRLFAAVGNKLTNYLGMIVAVLEIGLVTIVVMIAAFET